MTRKTVTITPEIIERAERRDSAHCMVAEAIKASIPEASNVSVDLATIRYTDPKRGKRYMWLTPIAAQHALISFDQGEHTEPFMFTLHSPAQVVPVQKQTKTADGRRTRANAPGRRKLVRKREYGNGGGNAVPTVEGGELPPIGALTNKPNPRLGKRRAFGLRQARA